MRRMRIGLVSLFFSICLAGLTACGPSDAPRREEPSAGHDKLVVYAVNYPLAWAAEQLAGEAVEVHFPAPPDTDPAYWEPDLDTISAYQSADLILLNGANYAKWIDRASLPQNRLLDTSAGFADQYIAIDSGPVHSHGPAGDHSHGEVAFTTWLDLSLYAQQVEAIAEALLSLLPDRAEAIAANRDALTARLIALDGKLSKIGAQLDGAPVLYSHPVYQYFDRRYGLNGIALHWEPDQEPRESHWAQLDRLLAAHPARLMLWEAEPTTGTLEALASRGIAAVIFEPQAHRGDEADFMSGLQHNVDRLSGAAAALAH